MVDLHEIVTEWVTDAGPGHRSVTYWNVGTAIADQRAAWAAFLTGADAALASSTVWTIQTAGRIIESTTGTLTGAWAESTAYTDSGDGVGTQLADATQALVRWDTGQVVNGRFLKGRTFLPGVAAGAVNDGNITPAAALSIQTAANTLIAAAEQFGVWHRPLTPGAGDWAPTSAASVWSEFAVLRSRRG